MNIKRLCCIRLIRISFVLLTLWLSACTSQRYQLQSEQAEVFGVYAIVSVDGKALDEKVNSVFLKEGSHIFQALYKTYTLDHLCEFEFVAESGQRYEIVGHAKQYPLTLYLWERPFFFWSIRLDPVEPTSCT